MKFDCPNCKTEMDNIFETKSSQQLFHLKCAYCGIASIIYETHVNICWIPQFPGLSFYVDWKEKLRVYIFYPKISPFFIDINFYLDFNDLDTFKKKLKIYEVFS